jgi:23S rRNA (pseudouridine1915-N3)-methyltransferase
MRLNIRAGGVIRKGPERELVDDYLRRADSLSKACGFLSVTETQIDLRSAKSRADETRILLHGLDPTHKLVVMDERGKSLTSRQIAKTLAGWRDDGISETHFVIGGADGFDPSEIPNNAIRWSFGTQVWPHKLVRVMLSEQLYRALSILTGAPYHRD